MFFFWYVAFGGSGYTPGDPPGDGGGGPGGPVNAGVAVVEVGGGGTSPWDGPV